MNNAARLLEEIGNEMIPQEIEHVIENFVQVKNYVECAWCGAYGLEETMFPHCDEDGYEGNTLIAVLLNKWKLTMTMTRIMTKIGKRR